MKNKLIGALILISLLAVLFYFLISRFGLFLTVIVIGFSLVLTALITLAIYLLTKE